MNRQKHFKGLINYKPSSKSSTNDEDEDVVMQDAKQRTEFVYHKLTKHLVQVEDLVLIVVPEEFEILQTLDPMLHGKVGHVLSINHLEDDCAEELIQVTLANRKGRGEVVSVPKFCVCLRADVFNERKEAFMKQRRTKSHENFSKQSGLTITTTCSTQTRSRSHTSAVAFDIHTSTLSPPPTILLQSTPSPVNSPRRVPSPNSPQNQEPQPAYSSIYSMGPKKTILNGINNRSKRTGSDPLIHSSTSVASVGAKTSSPRNLTCGYAFQKPSSSLCQQSNPDKRRTNSDPTNSSFQTCSSVPRTFGTYMNSYSSLLGDDTSNMIYSAIVPVNESKRRDISMDDIYEANNQIIRDGLCPTNI